MAITPERLKELLTYSPDTGLFYWRLSPSRKIRIGQQAGCLCNDGYIRIRVDGVLHLAHRLAWVLAFGVIPDGMQVDHRNRERSDNKITNLRLATHAQNMRNSSPHRGSRSRFKGVVWDQTGRNWAARICVDRKSRHLGNFATEELAAAAYDNAASELHGEFARTNMAA